MKNGWIGMGREGGRREDSVPWTTTRCVYIFSEIRISQEHTYLQRASQLKLAIGNVNDKEHYEGENNCSYYRKGDGES